MYTRPYRIAMVLLIGATLCACARAMGGEPPATDVRGEEPGQVRAGEECPAGSICGQDFGACQPVNVQWYFYSDLEFCLPSSCQRVRCDNFPQPGGTIDKPIGVLNWRGVYLDDYSDGCTRDVHNFRVRFYQDAGGAPQTPLTPFYSENLVATAVDTGTTVTIGSIPATIWQFTAVLTTPVNLTTGWFSIAGYGEPGCYFLWQGSPEGDHVFYQWYEVNGTVPGPAVTTYCDLAYCFGEKKVGACCDDCEGVCEDNVSELLCIAANGRFLLNGTCAAMDPVCGEALGACCRDDGSCTLVLCRPNPQHSNGCIPAAPCCCYGDLNCDEQISFADINPFVLRLSNPAAYAAAFPGCPDGNGDINDNGTVGFDDINPFVAIMASGQGPCANGAQDAEWLGAGSTCGDSAGTVNGGCDNLPENPPQFSPLGAPPCTVCGESWAEGEERDTDWYEFTAIEPLQLTWTVQAEFAAQVFIVPAGYCDADGPNACKLAEASGAPGSEVSVSAVVPAGTFWMFVAPAPGTEAACQSAYCATLTTEMLPDICQIICPTDPPPFHEAESCGQEPDLNPGCNATPPVFETIPIGGGGVYGVCGTLYACDGVRDTDWYQFTITSPKTVTIRNVFSEVPIQVTPLVDSTGTGPPASCDAYYYFPQAHWTACEPGMGNEISFALNAGTYWLLVAPSHFDGTSVFPILEGIWCGGLFQDYYFELEVPEP